MLFCENETWGILDGLFPLTDFSDDQRDVHKAFYSTYVVPRLGPSPTEFLDQPPCSYMGDDCTPIEFSWAEGTNGKPTIRFTMEPLSAIDGTPTPSSSWISCLNALRSFGKTDEFDLKWAEICHVTLVQENVCDIGQSKHASQFSIGRYSCSFLLSKKH